MYFECNMKISNINTRFGNLIRNVCKEKYFLEINCEDIASIIILAIKIIRKE